MFPCIVSLVTRYGTDYLRQAVRRRIEAEGLRPFSLRTGIPLGQLRSLLQGRAARSTTLELIASVLERTFIFSRMCVTWSWIVLRLTCN